MVERRVSAGDVVIKEGDQGDFFYAIENGIFSAKKAGETIFVYNGSGECYLQDMHALCRGGHLTYLSVYLCEISY